jgi:rhamnose transport system substrate-binding protein
VVGVRSQRRLRLAIAGLTSLALIPFALSAAGVSAAPARGACIRLAVEFKLQGLPVFKANWEGINIASKTFGICGPVAYGGPTTASAAGQVSDIRRDIAKHVQVIAITSDDPQVPASALAQAMRAGIKVITFDSDVPGARDFFIQDTAYNTIARGVIDAAVKFAGPRAEIGIMSSTPTATIQLAWINAIARYVQSAYPHLRFVPTGYGESVTSTSLSAAKAMIRSNPNLKAILPIDGAAVVGTAEAVSQLGDAGKIGVFGIGDPAPNRAYFADGSIQGLFLWNEIGQGELIDCVAELAVAGKIHAGARFKCPGVDWQAMNAPGAWTVASGYDPTSGVTRDTIVFSTPLEFTKSNYLRYSF